MPRLLIAAIGAVMLMLFLGPRVIRWLRDHEVGQFIRPRGEIPEGHAEKQGTPTMGGLLILSALFFSTLLWARLDIGFIWLILFVTLSFGLIGFWDDYAKVSKQNTKGAPGKVRFGLGLATR